MDHVLKISSSPPEMAMMKISASFPPWDGCPWAYGCEALANLVFITLDLTM